MNFKNLLFRAFKLGIIVNFSTVFLAIIYILAVENYFKPFNFTRSIQLGTILSAQNMFDFDNLKNIDTIARWKAIESKFDFFIPDTALRDDERVQPSPRVDQWCKIHRCWAHRIGYQDVRKRDYKVFTIDDWFFKNKGFLNTAAENMRVLPLDTFLAGLPIGSEVVLNEPLTLFQQNKLNFQLFKNWVIILKRKHPRIKFKLGLQLHFQWLDTQFWRLSDGVLFSQFADFSKNYGFAWGISEFSIYDRIWRRRLVATYDRSGRRTDGLVSWFESLVPDRLRRAIVLHMTYSIHKRFVAAGASYVVAWGNFPTIWFSGEIDDEYRSTFALFDWDGKPLPMYWAILRGISDANIPIVNP